MADVKKRSHRHHYHPQYLPYHTHHLPHHHYHRRRHRHRDRHYYRLLIPRLLVRIFLNIVKSIRLYLLNLIILLHYHQLYPFYHYQRRHLYHNYRHRHTTDPSSPPSHEIIIMSISTHTQFQRERLSYVLVLCCSQVKRVLSLRRRP